MTIFHGQVSPQVASIFARADFPAGCDPTSCRLTGTLRGPRSRTGHTLPATHTFQDLGPGPNLMARVVVPDPCVWSVDQPALYDAELQIVCDGRPVDSFQQAVGLRMLGASGRSLFRQGRRAVIRGVSASSAAAATADVWVECRAAVLTDFLDDCRGREWSELGILTVARVVARDSAELAAELTRLAQFPAVGVVVVDGSPTGAIDPIRPNNMLLAQALDVDGPAACADWADLVFAEVGDPAKFAERAATWDLPVLAYRPLQEPCGIAEARRHCDDLQRDLAPFGQFAGYLV